MQGLTVPYNGNLWKLEKPEYGPLADAAVKILDNQEQYRAGARKRAEDNFNIEETIRQYLQGLIRLTPPLIIQIIDQGISFRKMPSQPAFKPPMGRRYAHP